MTYIDPKSPVNFDPIPDPQVNDGAVPETKYDPLSRYYAQGGIEVQDIIRAKLTSEQYFGWLLGNVIKYSTRLNWKGQNVRDAEKCARYAQWMQDFLLEGAE